MSAKRCILALDQGTTSSRAMVVDETGAVVSVAQHPFKQIFPKPGWVEHSPTEIWSSQSGVVTEALAKVDLTSRSIAAIGITNQRETTIVWDRETGEPIYNAIVWQDRRTAEFCDRLRADAGSMIQQKTGLIPDAYFSGSKVNWILANVEGARAKAEAGKLAFGTVDSWLIWKLTKGERHVTDVTNASRTMLFNIHTMEWDEELLKLLGVPRSMLPEVVASSGVCGTASGLVRDVPIAGIAGDQQAALFGQMCTSPGMAKCTYGTGAFMLLNIGQQPMTSKHRLLTTVAWKIGNTVEYAFEGSMLMAGAVVQWLRDELQLIRTSAEIESLAASVSDANGVVLVPAFAGLGAPHWDQYARGALVGLTRGSSRAHIARAALEGIALQATDVLEAMQADSGLSLSQLRVDGGAAANNLLMQIQADALGIEVVRPKNAEATVMGAAYLAGLAVGYWPDQEAIASQWQMDRIFQPKIGQQERDKVRATWRRALERAKQWTKEEETAS
ncbi:glycerol kinase GlpK [Edaphobacter albus]|uniref:glycerol kinase GlpK n=1 Tax=Edaphobacter sp. 4G125 TaxID=2763071 RepID=UPI001646035A|nr:glycerol kinase GlpK [Edaphobacter sp. 4G125]QNI37340.1 glycerol kinase GlpK [Edaphobacter sp. 4G125]